MASLTVFKVRFTPKWQISLLTLLAIALFIRLGVWQLARANEKKQMQLFEASFINQQPIQLDPVMVLPKQYQPVSIKGYFLPQVFLLDNQHYQHQFGYNVLSPLVLADNHIVLVDRGWVAGETTRQTFPNITIPAGRLSLQGSIYYPSEKNWLLGEALEKKQANLAVIELIDIKIVSNFLHKPCYPYIIRLSPHEAHGFVREWAVVAMPPHRHQGYAFQWFAIALVIFVLFITLNLKKKT